ncbi:MAG TPA: Lrp/AsnC ligand binding domain-containing protein [Atribacteraceae bacterium]|nr:Lrp/AsnC ligand binding domain-containing protein [Atribacteraceae bacterium]
MVVQAYILIQVETGKAVQVKKELSLLEGVKKVDRVMGPYDLIALVEGKTNQEIGENLLGRLQESDGIKRTLTCPII